MVTMRVSHIKLLLVIASLSRALLLNAVIVLQLLKLLLRGNLS